MIEQICTSKLSREINHFNKTNQMIFRTFASAVIAAAFNSSIVSASRAVEQEDAAITSATQDLLSETMAEGETSAGGIFGTPEVPIFNLYENGNNELWKKGKHYNDD